jgi:hypothetical protein
LIEQADTCAVVRDELPNQALLSGVQISSAGRTLVNGGRWLASAARLPRGLAHQVFGPGVSW